MSDSLKSLGLQSEAVNRNSGPYSVAHVIRKVRRRPGLANDLRPHILNILLGVRYQRLRDGPPHSSWGGSSNEACLWSVNA